MNIVHPIRWGCKPLNISKNECILLREIISNELKQRVSIAKTKKDIRMLHTLFNICDKLTRVNYE